MTNLTRRQFGKLTATTILGALIGWPEQTVKPAKRFAFLDRIGDNSVQTFITKTDAATIERNAQFYATHDDNEPPESLLAMRRKQFPAAKIARATCSIYGYPEPCREFGESYLAFARDIIRYAEKRLPHIETVPLEFLLAGTPRRHHDRAPLYVDWFKYKKCQLDIDEPTRGALELTTSEATQGDMVINAFNVHGRVGHDMTLEKGEPIISLSTGNNHEAGLLGAPLSEYYGLAFIPAASKHFEALEASYGGAIPANQLYSINEMVLVGLEAMSEAAAHQLLLEFVEQDNIRSQLSPSVKDNIVKYVTERMPKLSWVYQYNPAAFRWMEKEGIDVAVGMYLNDSFGCVEKIKEYNK